MKMKQQSYVGS